MAVVTGSFTYASSIDGISNLYARFAYDDTLTDAPVLAAMHGYQQTAAGFPAEVMARFASAGTFVVVPGMRGRDSASGAQDSGGREIQDIIDAVEHARSAYPTRCSQSRASLVGYSGGGGNAMAVACKFPDFFTNVASHFGMSNFIDWDEYSGRAVTYSWIGGTPEEVPAKYNARNTRLAITNFTGGKFYLFHDRQDVAVNVDQSELLGDVLSAAGRTNFMESYSNTGDAVRWLHGYPIAAESPDLYQTEQYWLTDTVNETHEAWSVPASGTLKCIGYIVTKRFSVWLGDGTANTATVTYNGAAITVTPDAECSVSVTANGTTQTHTVDTSGYTFPICDLDIILESMPLSQYDLDVILEARVKPNPTNGAVFTLDW